MTARERYATPAAFRTALSDRLRNSADGSKWTIQQLQRQVAYDRLLERLYFVDDGWIVKGATALLARNLGVRGSLDVDVYRADAQEIAEADLRRAANIDLDDWFVFHVGVATPIGNNGIRFPVVATIGQTTWAEFHVDLSGPDLRITGHPDDVPPIARGIIPSVEQSGYRAYPLADHVADKVAATYERHGASDNPSTRYRDLIERLKNSRASDCLIGILPSAVVGAGSYDMAMPWNENTVRDTGEEIAACLAKGDFNSAIRLAFRFLERYDKSDWDTRHRITAEPPLTTGSDRYDALLAGIVEFACASHGLVAPSWVNAERYFLSKWWFVSGMTSLHANALVHSPISLARRGVFVTQGALEYA